MSGASTRADLVRAATALMAADGVDGPSLREITRAAGARNTAALQYHFGDRDALLAAVVGAYADTIAEHRDRLVRASSGSLRGLARALVDPYVALLTEDGGPAYVQVLHEVWSQPQRFADLVVPDASMLRWSAAVAAHLPPRALGRPLHRRYAATRFVLSETADRARREHADHRLFASHLVDMTEGLLAAPVSAETRALIR